MTWEQGGWKCDWNEGMIAGSQWLLYGEVWPLKKMCSILVDVEKVCRAFNCMIYCGLG